MSSKVANKSSEEVIKSSRVARKPIEVPVGVEVRVEDTHVLLKGPKGEIKQPLPKDVSVGSEGNQLKVVAKNTSRSANAIAGTIRALLNNHVEGVSKGFSKKLQLVGVGYRAQLADGKLNLTLGFSHPVAFQLPEGITVLSPAVTEVEVLGVNRQLVGQVAANIRGICNGLRKPEPYKGKGIRYANENIILKETKKK